MTSATESAQAPGSPAVGERRKPQKYIAGSILMRHLNEVGLVAGIGLLYLFFGITAYGFIGISNQLAMLQEAATIGIPAWGMTLVIIAAEIDISIGPAVAFTGVMFAIATSQWHTGMAIGVIFTLLVGAACGGFAGFLRAQFNMPSFIATLGLWSAMRGFAEYLTNGIPMALPDSSFVNAMAGNVLGIPVPAIVMVVLFGVFTFVLQKTSYGRSVVAIGGNPVAAGLAGIPVKRIRIALFATTGLLSAIAGILLAARLLSGNGDSATGLEFNVIAAVVVGGTVLSGGRGSMLGTFLGVAFITVIGDGLVLLGVNSFLQQVVQGVIIVLAVLANLVAGQHRGQTSRRQKRLGLSLTDE